LGADSISVTLQNLVGTHLSVTLEIHIDGDRQEDLLFEQFAAEGERGGSLEAALLKFSLFVVVSVQSSKVG